MSEQPMHGVVPDWTLGDRLGKALRIGGIGSGEMAEYLGVSRNTIGNYVGDRSKVSKATLMAWALKTGVSLQWLETGVGKPLPQPPGNGGPLVNELERIATAKRSRKAATRGGTDTPRYLIAA